jgi:hypothetical protein
VLHVEASIQNISSFRIPVVRITKNCMKETMFELTIEKYAEFQEVEKIINRVASLHKNDQIH